MLYLDPARYFPLILYPFHYFSVVYLLPLAHIMTGSESLSHGERFNFTCDCPPMVIVHYAKPTRWPPTVNYATTCAMLATRHVRWAKGDIEYGFCVPVEMQVTCVDFNIFHVPERMHVRIVPAYGQLRLPAPGDLHYIDIMLGPGDSIKSMTGVNVVSVA